MKKLMTLMLGLSLILGSTVAFAADGADTTKTKKSTKKTAKAKNQYPHQTPRQRPQVIGRLSTSSMRIP